MIAYYDAGAYELRLGVRCEIYASATATGYMYVRAKATSTGWVTATIKWLIKAHVVSTGLGPHDAYITIDFVLFDKTDKTTFTQELLEARGYVAGEWRLDTVDVPLYADHRYNFYLNATAHAHGMLDGCGVADAEGFFGESDRRIEWGYLEVPNTVADVSGGCPYVYTWNGQRYVMDNNLLPASEHTSGDIVDYYRLEQPLVRNPDGTYSLLLSEFENEHDYFDQSQLLAVDHQSDVNVAVSPSGEILTYTDPYAPKSAVDNEGENVKHLVNTVDENYYQGYNGSHITLNFGNLDVGQGVKLVMRADAPIWKKSIHIQIPDENGDWKDITSLIPRTHWSTDIIDLSEFLGDEEETIKIRLYFTAEHKLDYVGLDTSLQATINVLDSELVSAVHSVEGDVKASLLQSDNVYAELTPAQNIQVTFTLPEQTMEARTYIIIVEGSYCTIT